MGPPRTASDITHAIANHKDHPDHGPDLSPTRPVRRIRTGRRRQVSWLTDRVRAPLAFPVTQWHGPQVRALRLQLRGAAEALAGM